MRYRVSAPTLRNALEVLQAEGLVEKRQGSGNFIRRPGPRLMYASDRYEVPRPMVTMANAAVTVTLEASRVRADARLSLLLAVRKGSPLTEYAFVGHRGTSPCSLARVYVPYEVARLGVPAVGPGASPWGDGIRDLLSEAGVRVAATVERVVTRFPTAEEAYALHMSTRSPVLTVERTSTDAHERVVEGALLVLPGDRAEVLFTTRATTERAEEPAGELEASE